MMYILVTGDRLWTDIETVYAALLPYVPMSPTIVHGYADGADLCAHIVGEALGLTTIPCPAHWSHNAPRWVEIYGPCAWGCEKASGRAAGALRNRYMVRTYPITLVLAFHDNLAASKGTKDMVTVAKKYNIPVKYFTSTP